jgi:short-subunit dehydrogenase
MPKKEYPMTQKVQKSILITGCSSGIGLKAALDLQKRGYQVFATARKQSDVDKLNGQGLCSFLLDVTDPESIQKALAQVLVKTGGTLEALFNNAGYMQAGAFEDMTDQLDRAQLETNFFGPINLTRAVLPIMRGQGHGRIIQNSSILGVITMPYYGAYNASKHALEGYTSTLRQELRGSGIHVSLINPGPITSNLRDTAFTHYQHALKTHQSGHHDNVYKKMEATYFKKDRKSQSLTLSPEAVTSKLIHALESPRPKAHYYVGMAAQFMALMQRWLPDGGMDWLISRVR